MNSVSIFFATEHSVLPFYDAVQRLKANLHLPSCLATFSARLMSLVPTAVAGTERFFRTISIMMLSAWTVISILPKYIGASPTPRIIDFFLDNSLSDYSKNESARERAMSRVTFKYRKELERSGAVKPTGEILCMSRPDV